MTRRGSDRNRPPLDAAALEQAALAYVARYATTRRRLADYLARKLADRGWAGEGAAPVDRIVARLAGAGFVDDRAFAAARAAALGRRGYGAHRVGAALRAAGVAGDDARDALDETGADAWRAAEAFAKRRKIGPFAEIPSDSEQRRKALAAMLRAGHPPAIARAFVRAAPGETLDPEG